MAVTPLTQKISDLTLDTMLIAQRCKCCVRETVVHNLQRLTSKTDNLHSARKAARAIEDNGYASEWTHRQLKEMERVGELERLERRALPIGTER